MQDQTKLTVRVPTPLLERFQRACRDPSTGCVPRGLYRQAITHMMDQFCQEMNSNEDNETKRFVRSLHVEAGLGRPR